MDIWAHWAPSVPFEFIYYILKLYISLLYYEWGSIHGNTAFEKIYNMFYFLK